MVGIQCSEISHWIWAQVNLSSHFLNMLIILSGVTIQTPQNNSDFTAYVRLTGGNATSELNVLTFKLSNSDIFALQHSNNLTTRVANT